MKEFKKYLIWAGILVLLSVFRDVAMKLFGVIGWLLLGIIILLLAGAIVAIIHGAIRQRKLSSFMKNNEGKYFLWYSSNKRLKETIESDLKPLMDINYHIIYTNREQVISQLPDEIWSYLRIETNTIKFPRLIKISSGKVLAESFYHEVNLLRQAELDKEEYKNRVILKLNKLKNE